MKQYILKRKKILTIFTLIGIGILISTLLFVYIKRPSPKNTLIEYMSYINSKNYEKMYEMISDKSKSTISKEDFINRNKKIYEGIEAKDLKININNVSDYKGSKSISYETSMKTLISDVSFSNKVLLNRDSNRYYKIEWDSSVIFPNLGRNDKVRVAKIVGERGEILDRNGVVLAGKGRISSVGIVPEKLGEDQSNNIKKLAVLLGLTEDDINKKLSKSYVKPDSFVEIKLISKDNTELESKLLEIPGVKISSVDSRVYPLKESAAHLTGYIQSINGDELKTLKEKGYTQNSIIGKIGLEKLLEDRIRGIDGKSIDIVDENGNVKETLAKIPAHNGEDVRLTIDSALQTKLYNQLKDDKSSTVVMNPITGEILALISTPGYDPNEFVLGITQNRWNELNNSEKNPMYNRFKATFSPGSSFKPIIGAIGLTTGKISHDENFGYSGLSWSKDSSWGGYKVTTLKDYGNNVVMRNALIYSDNIYFAKAALKIGGDTLANELLKLGFTENIPFEFGLSTSEFGKDNKFSSEIQLADSGYGQGQILVNPIHMASMYSAFLNNGNMIKPYLEYKDSPKAEILKKQVFSKEAVNNITSDLIQVVENKNGTAHSAMIKGMTIAGKTGTAEIKASKEDTTGTELGWFVAFTPNKDGNKQYLALSMVEDVKNRGGSHYVVPIIKSIFEN